MGTLNYEGLLVGGKHVELIKISAFISDMNNCSCVVSTELGNERGNEFKGHAISFQSNHYQLDDSTQRIL